MKNVLCASKNGSDKMFQAEHVKESPTLSGYHPKLSINGSTRQPPQLPGTKHLLNALKTFGPAFAAEVLGPCGDWTRSLSFAARTEKIRNEIEALSRDFEKVAHMGHRMDVAANFEMALNKSKAALEKAQQVGRER